MNRKRQAKQDRVDRLEVIIKEIEEGTTLEYWSSLIEEISCPPEVAVALATMRPELMKLAKPRELTAEEAAALYRVIEVLIRTNFALQKHAIETAKMVNIWSSSFQQLESLGYRINEFASFRRPESNEDEEEF